MSFPGSIRVRSLFWPAAIALGTLFWAGCRGVATKDEKSLRAQAAKVSNQLRPQGERPSLPDLKEDAPFSNYVYYAILNQPQVAAAYDDWLASIERVTQARSLPDPRLTFEMYIQDIVMSVMPGLMMDFPGPGKLGAQARVAGAESDAKYAAFETAILEAVFNLKKTYYPLYFLDQKLRVNRETLGLLGDLEQLARAQNQVGKVTLQDVLRAQIEAERLRNEVANLEDSRRSLLAQFKAALGLDPAAPAPPVPTNFVSSSITFSEEELLKLAAARNPRLKAMEADIRKAEASIAVAHKARIPDFSAGLEADAKAAPTMYNPQLSMTLPIWRDKLAAQLAEAQADKRAAEARLSAEQLALAVDFAEQSYLYREASRNLSLLREQLLPKARQSFEVARIGYLSGRLDFFNLSDTERTLLDFQLSEIEAAVQRELALAQLSMLAADIPLPFARPIQLSSHSNRDSHDGTRSEK